MHAAVQIRAGITVAPGICDVGLQDVLDDSTVTDITNASVRQILGQLLAERNGVLIRRVSWPDKRSVLCRRPSAVFSITS